jgi:hypothetical protein
VEALKGVTDGALDEDNFGYFHSRTVELGGQ